MTSSVVIPGQPILAETGYLRGHGTFVVQKLDGPQLVASVAGEINRHDKLVSVFPIQFK